MSNTSILDYTILPTLGAAARYAANLFDGTARQQPQLDADAQPDAENGGYLGSMFNWVLGRDDSESDSGSGTGPKPDNNTPKQDKSPSPPKQSNASSINDALNGLDERFLPTIDTIIEARDRALREGRPVPPAWRRLRRPGDLPLPNDDTANDDAQDKPDEEFVPNINLRPLLYEPLVEPQDEGENSS